MENLAGHIATGVVTFIVGFLLQWLKARPHVVYWTPHWFRFDLTNPKVSLQTDALTIQNLGRQAAEDVELIMTARPDFFQFSPAFQYAESNTPEGHFVLTISSLGAKEFFTLQLLSYTQVPKFLSLRSKAGPAKEMPF